MVDIPDIETFEDASAKKNARTKRSSASLPNPTKGAGRSTSTNESSLAGTPAVDTTAVASSTGFWSFSKQQQYYTSAGRKVGDFFFGFLGIPIGLEILFFLLRLLTSSVDGYGLSVGFFLLSVLLYFVILVLSFILGRRWIGIGMLVALALLFCLFFLAIMMLSGSFF